MTKTVIRQYLLFNNNSSSNNSNRCLQRSPRVTCNLVRVHVDSNKYTYNLSTVGFHLLISHRNKVLQPCADGWRYHRLPGVPNDCVAGTADEHIAAEGASKPRSGTPWPRKKCVIRAGPDVEVPRVEPTVQDSEQARSLIAHDTDDGCSAAAGTRGGETATTLVPGNKELPCGGRGRSLELLVPKKASSQEGEAAEMKLPDHPRPQRFNGEANEDYESGQSRTLYGKGGCRFLLRSRSENSSLPKPQASGEVVDQAQHRDNTNRTPGIPQQPRPEALPEQVTARSTAVTTAKREDSELPRNTAQCTVDDARVTQKAAAVGSNPVIGPACTSSTVVAAESFQVTSALSLPSSPTPVRDLDSSNRNMAKFAETRGCVGGGPHSCVLHGLVACTLCSTCASDSLWLSGTAGCGAAGPQYAETAPVIDDTETLVSVVTTFGNTSHIADHRSASSLADAVQPIPSHGVGDDQVHYGHNTDNMQNEQQIEPAFLRTANGIGAATGVVPGDPCDRHLLFDCILCKMSSPTEYGGGFSPTVLGGVSPSSHGGALQLQGMVVGRSTSLPALGAISQRGDGGGTRGGTPAAAIGTSVKRSTASDSSMNRCERHDLLGCFLCDFGTANSTAPGGGVSKRNYLSKEGNISSSQRLVLPPPVFHDADPQKGSTPISRGLIDQRSKNSTGVTVGFGVVPPKKRLSAVGNHSVPLNDQLTSHSDRLKRGISNRQPTGNSLIVTGGTNQVRESPNGINQAGDDGKCTVGTTAGKTPVRRSSDASARRHHSRGRTPRRRRGSIQPTCVKSRASSRCSSSLSLLDSESASRSISAGLSPRARNESSSSTIRDNVTTADARGSAQAHTVVSATRAREKGVSGEFTARAITAAIAVLH